MSRDAQKVIARCAKGEGDRHGRGVADPIAHPAEERPADAVHDVGKDQPHGQRGRAPNHHIADAIGMRDWREICRHHQAARAHHDIQHIENPEHGRTQHLARAVAVACLPPDSRHRRCLARVRRANESRRDQDHAALDQSQPEKRRLVAACSDHHADGNDSECGSSAKARRDQANRQAAIVLEPFHRDPDACRVDGSGTEACEGTAEVKQGQRVRPGLDDPTYRDQYAAGADRDARANVRTKLVCDPTGKRCSPGLQRHE